ncbi:hypothetical protein [Desulfonatronum parangueonense]
MIKYLFDVSFLKKSPTKISPYNSVFWNTIHHPATIGQNNIAAVPFSGTAWVYGFHMPSIKTVAFSTVRLEAVIG